PDGISAWNGQHRATCRPGPATTDRSTGSEAPVAEEGVGPRLPLSFTRFFGRDVELARLETLLSPRDEGYTRCAGTRMRHDEPAGPSHPSSLIPAPSRLAPPTGPPGCGKTRLAVEIGGRLSRFFSGAVWFVPLADVTEASGVPAALAEALRLPRSADLDPL